MAILVVKHPDGTELEYELQGDVTLGRADANGVVLEEGGVSRQHARVFQEGEEILVEDLGSSNGTFVDGERIAAPTAMGPRSQLVIGEYQITIRSEAPRPRPIRRAATARPKAPVDRHSPTGAQEALQLPPRATRMVEAAERPLPSRRAVRPSGSRAAKASGPALRGMTGPWLNQLYPIQGVVTVGRSPGVDVLLEDDSVSRQHAELEVTAEGVVLRDLGSANGTMVNGQPVSGDTTIHSGDLLTFGVVDLAYEEGDKALAPSRQGRRKDAGSDTGAGDAARRKRLLMMGGGVGGLLAILAIFKVALGGEAAAPGPRTGPDMVKGQPTEDLNLYLSECRSYSSTETGNPNWERAELACNKALDIDPIHAEANQLIRRIRVEKECADYFARGEKALARLREEEALELFGKIASDCSYYVKARPRVEQAIDGVMKRTAEDCRRYMSARQYQAALPRCELYMKFACQSMSPDQLVPPLGQTLVTHSRRLKRGEWRPQDPKYLLFLRAREKVEPEAPPWRCPPLSILRREAAPPDPLEDVRKAIQTRFDDKDMVAAVAAYWQGKSGDAINLLQRIREHSGKAAIHSLADNLRKDVTQVEQLFKEGQANLQTEDPERAAEPFTEALAVDKILMADQAERAPSFFRRSIERDMASSCYRKGKAYADRQDYQRACRVWKLGFGFFRGNTELLRALGNVCSARAVNGLSGASSCADLPTILEYAVDGDGIKERVAEKKVEWGCPE